MKKYFLGVLFSAIFSFFSFTQAEFSDVTEETKYKTAIEYLQEKNIVKGDGETGYFRPYSTINRAEFLKIVLEASKQEILESDLDSSCFPDIAGDEWFSKYVCYAKEKGFVKGRGDGKFYPADEITFVEAAKIMVEVLDIETPDVKEGVEWYEKYVKALTETKKAPRTVTSFDYKVKRNDMAEMVWRVLEEESLKNSSYEWDIYLDWISFKGIKLVEKNPERFKEMKKRMETEYAPFQMMETDISELNHLLIPYTTEDISLRIQEYKDLNLFFFLRKGHYYTVETFVIHDKKKDKIYISNKNVWDAKKLGNNVFIGVQEEVGKKTQFFFKVISLN